MNKSSLKKCEKYITAAIFAVLAMISVIGVINREPWRDEAQAWLIARDCGFFELFGQMTYEGHPALWQLILFPFAKIGLPFETCYVINCAFYFALLYLTLYKCPLPLWQRVAGVCACPVFVYSYQARSYMLMFLLLAVCAVMYPKRKEKPVVFAICVFLLANIHAYAVGAAGGLFLCSLIDACEENFRIDRNRKISLSVMLTGFMLFLLQVVPSLGKNEFVTDEIPIKNGLSVNGITDGAFSVFSKISTNLFITYGSRIVEAGTVLIIFLFLAGVFACLFNLKRAAVFFGAVVLPFMMLCLLYAQHAELMLVFLFFTGWVMNCEKTERAEIADRIPKGAYKGFIGCLCVIILLSLPHTKLYIESNNSKTAYTSGSIQTAEFLNTKQDYIIVAHYPPQASAFVALLDGDQKVWHPYTEDFGSYVSWSKELRDSVDTLTTEQLIYKIESNFDYGTPIFVVLSRDVPRESSDRLAPVFETVNCPVDEHFTVYEFRWSLGE